jgi:WD40 repeat protein
MEDRFSRGVLGHHYASAEAAHVVCWRRLADDQILHRWQWEGSPCVALDVSPDGRYVFAFCRDDQLGKNQVARVWDCATGKLVLHRPIAGWEHAFRPKSKVLALVQADGSVALCDLGTGHDLPPVPAGLTPNSLRFDPSGQYLAVSSKAQHDIKVWDLATGKVALWLASDHWEGCLAWSPDGSLLAARKTDTNIHVYTFPGGKIQAVLRGHEHIVTGVEFHPSGRLLASTSHDDTTRLWCFSPGGELVLRGERLLGFSRDGRRLTTGSGQTVTVWELQGPGDCLHYLPHGEGPSRGPWGIAFAPDGRLLASASQDGALLWDAAAARLVGRLPSGDGYAVAIHPKGNCLFTTGPGAVMQWPIAPVGDGQGLHLGPAKILLATTADSRSLRIDIAGTGESLLVGEGEGGVHFVHLAEPAKVSRLGTHACLFGVALSPDGRWAVCAGDSGDDAFCIWDAGTSKVVHHLSHKGKYPRATFSPDGRWLVTGVRHEFCFWEVGSWKLQARLPRDPCSLYSAVAFAGNGRLLALVDGRNRIHLYDAATLPLRHLATLETPEGSASLMGLCLSPDGIRLAATTEHNVIALWDLRLLRQDLVALDLDWDMPPYPSAAHAAEPVQPLTVEILGTPKQK